MGDDHREAARRYWAEMSHRHRHKWARNSHRKSSLRLLECFRDDGTMVQYINAQDKDQEFLWLQIASALNELRGKRGGC